MGTIGGSVKGRMTDVEKGFQRRFRVTQAINVSEAYDSGSRSLRPC